MATMRPVDLEEPNPDRPRAGRARTRRRWVPLAGVAAGVVAALVAGQFVLDGRRAAYAARLDGLPGAVWKLDDPAARWQAVSADPRVNGTRLRDVIVTAYVQPDGEVTVNGFALRTGPSRWSTRLHAPPAVVAGFRRGQGESFDRGVECRTSAHRGGGDARAVCVVGARSAVAPTDGDSEALMVVVDDAGRVRAQRTVADTYWAVRGTHVQMATMRRTGAQESVTVVEQTWDGDQVWSSDLGLVDAVDAAGNAEVFARDISTDGTWTAVNAGTRAFVLDEHGTVVADVPTGAGKGAALVSGGALWVADYSGDVSGRLVLPRAIGVTMPKTRGRDAEPQPARVSVDDGSAPNIVPVQLGVSLFAFDTRTGKPVWTVDLAGGVNEAVLLDWVLFVAQLNEVTAIDAITGQQRWSTALPFYPSSLTTDGRRLVATSDALALLDPHDGQVAQQRDGADLMAGNVTGAADSVSVYTRNGLLVLQPVAGGNISADLWVIA